MLSSNLDVTKERGTERTSALWPHQLNLCSFDKGGYKSLGCERSHRIVKLRDRDNCLKEMFRALMSEVWDQKSAYSGLQEIENNYSCFQGLTGACPTHLNGTLISELLTCTAVELSLAEPSHHQNCQQVGFHLVVTTVQNRCSSRKSKSSLRHCSSYPLERWMCCGC